MSRIRILRGQQVLASRENPGEVQLVYDGVYQDGDAIEIESEWENAVIRVDQALAEARVYLPEKRMTFRPPMGGDGLAVYAPGTFLAGRHVISLREDASNERRNLALNPIDQRGAVQAYPHATANVETRNESVFCARNVVDGLHSARGHGEWPYQSWGIGTRTDAALTIDFGRTVVLDEAVLYLRADFPHDAWWTSGTLVMSDGAEVSFPLAGIDGAQRVSLGRHQVTWVRLERLQKCDMPSAFPALRQLELYGQAAEV